MSKDRKFEDKHLHVPLRGTVPSKDSRIDFLDVRGLSNCLHGPLSLGERTHDPCRLRAGDGRQGFC